LIFAVIADIHSNIEALEAVLEDIKNRGIYKVYCAGDLVGYYPYPNEVIERLRRDKIQTIMGNYDESVGKNLLVCGCDYDDEHQMMLAGQSLEWTKRNTTDENKKYLRNLPRELRFNISGKEVLMVHGSPRALNEYLKLTTPSDYLKKLAEEKKADVLIFGHTHVPYHRKVDEYHFINAGSVGKPKHGNPNATYVVVDIAQTHVKVDIIEVPYDYEKVIQAVEKSDLPDEFAELLRKGTG